MQEGGQEKCKNVQNKFNHISDHNYCIWFHYTVYSTDLQIGHTSKIDFI